MNDYVILVLSLIVAYFFGSIIFAIPITKIAIGKDIRKIGNTNPGTSNTFKNVGPIAGTLVAVLDMLKGVIPIVIVKALWFKGDTWQDWLFLYLIGFSAILGHTRPWWNKFKKGGGGMGTATGMMIYFTPVELAISMIISIVITYTAMKNANYKFGRWVMMFSLAFIPFIVLIFNMLMDVQLFGHISIGGHALGMVLGTFGLLVLLLILNSHELVHWLKNPSSNKNPRDKGEAS